MNPFEKQIHILINTMNTTEVAVETRTNDDSDKLASSFPNRGNNKRNVDNSSLNSEDFMEHIALFDKTHGSAEAHECSLKDNENLHWFWRFMSVMHRAMHTLAKFPCCRNKSRRKNKITQPQETDV